MPPLQLHLQYSAADWASSRSNKERMKRVAGKICIVAAPECTELAPLSPSQAAAGNSNKDPKDISRCYNRNPNTKRVTTKPFILGFPILMPIMGE